MKSLDLASLTRRSEADPLLAASVPDAGLRAFLLQNIAADGERLRWRINIGAIETCMPSLLAFDGAPPGAVYPGPTLFIHGERSDYLDESHLGSIRALFPAAELASVADSGHWVHAENPQGFLDVLLTFLTPGA